MLAKIPNARGMPPKKEVEDVLFVRGLGDHAAAINAIAENHRITPQELARGLISSAAKFFNRYKYFTFPAVVVPLPPRSRLPSAKALIERGADAIAEANITPMPDPELMKFSTTDLLHEIARREMVYDFRPETTSFELNEPTSQGGRVARAGLSGDSSQSESSPATPRQSTPKRRGKRGSGPAPESGS